MTAFGVTSSAQAEMREEAWRLLQAELPAANADAARRCAVRLRDALPDRDRLERNLVMVAFGGGKDSAYTLAFVRAMQLVLFQDVGRTFRLRVATNRHAGMPRAVMENIDRAYRGLRLPEDPDCELLLIDGNEVTPFDVDAPQREHVVRRNRLDILMTGHRTFADGRPTFCNACNVSVVNSFARAAAHGDGADLIITGDSPREQRQYAVWMGRLARRLGTRKAASGSGFGRFLTVVDGISQAYFADIHGSDDAAALAERRVSADVPERLAFFSIYADTEYASGDHMDLLTGLLGFEFDDIAFSFTESDCGNPALMAHLRGLKCERVYHRPYAEGVQEYLEFAVGLMREKDFPGHLIDVMRARYSGAGHVDRMRRAAQDYALATFGLTEPQLVCMVYAPFGGQGAGLADFLGQEHPRLLLRIDDLHRVLRGRAPESVESAVDLERISGLELRQLRVLYSSPRPGPGGGPDVVEAVLDGDPHKAVIRTRLSKNGPTAFERISGR